MRINDEFIRHLVNITTASVKVKHGSPEVVTLGITNDLLGVLLGFSMVFVGWTGVFVPPRISLFNILTFFPQDRDLWKNIEKLVDQKIQTHHLETINSDLRGLVENMKAVWRVHKQFSEAPSQDREQQGELLRSHHNAFLMFLRSSIPHYQMKTHAVVSLPDFAMAATIQTIMLAEALKYGLSWGYTPVYLRAIRAEFNRKTGLGAKVPAIPLRQKGAARLPGIGDGIAPRGVGHRLQMQLLVDTIHQGEAEGWSTELVDTWKHAYTALSVQRREVSVSSGHGHGNDTTDDVHDDDYPTYVRKTYEHGRTLVQSYQSELGIGLQNPGRRVAAKLRAYADYDALMIMNVLTYAEYWPYLTGEFKVPDSVVKNVDREIYSGPYGRWADWVPWSTTHPPPVTVRIGNITSLVVRAGRSIDGFRQASGGHWGYHYGSETKGEAHHIELGPDEFIDNVNVTFGGKIGSLTFESNKAKYGPYGTPKHTKWANKWKQALLHNATLGWSVNRTGYGLSSVHCTRWSWFTPSGCEGVFFGFRPLYIATDDHESCNCGQDQNGTYNPFAALADLDVF